MANVAHSTLTGSELHEPKGIESASSGEVYVADGLGSGGWANVGTSSFTGMIADFTWPVVQDGWLECDGSTISTTTYSTLYSVMSIASSGTRTSSSPTVTSIPSTANFRVGYYVFGAGIASGTTILSIDSASQITLSGNASSSGTSAFAVSPWLLNTGTIKLPDLSVNGKYRRSRSSSTRIGETQSDQNKAHTHSLSVSGTTSSDGAHSHTINVTDPGHAHSTSMIRYINNTFGGSNDGAYAGSVNSGTITGSAATNTTGITASSVSTGVHTHTVTSTGTSGSEGGTEARPTSIVVMTCVKT